ncbi:MAG: DMT family transporter, partial [Candidatus Diapherotrites archaeon]
GIYLAESATITGLIAKSNLIFTAILTTIFFSEERKVFSSKKFVFGTILASIGVIGVITAGKEISFNFGLGALLILISQVSWSFYSISMKKLIKNNSRTEALCIIIPLAFLASIPIAGYNFSQNPQTNAVSLSIPIIAGISLGAANLFEFKAIEKKGLLVTSAFTLVNPLITGIIAFILFTETITLAQAFFAAILITGALLILKCKCLETKGD